MAQNPIGTVADEERLVLLHARDDGYIVDVTEPVQHSAVPEAGTFAWRYREEGDVDRLALAPVDDPDDACALPTLELSDLDDALTIAVPEPLLADGLGLDTAPHDDDNPLLFEPRELDDGIAVGMGPEGDPGVTWAVAIELVPVRFSEGTPLHHEPIDAGSLDSDPVAEAQLAHEDGEGTPRSDAISAPLDPPVFGDVVEEADAPRDQVVGALETISRQNLVGPENDRTSFGPLVVDEHVVVGLEEDTWQETVAAELDADVAALQASREAHARQAAALVPQSEGEDADYGGYVPVVVQPARTFESGS
jgi:hypothetical protein